jgi:hypothetical protein
VTGLKQQFDELAVSTLFEMGWTMFYVRDRSQNAFCNITPVMFFFKDIGNVQFNEDRALHFK